ncbi:unnamed protein product [Rotaria sp. Silwood1]|nr:unnamed protein product [Rotaria sp. Silwood1]CAF1331554.1 unnamed protein product [Rotaria sp. Silwood1]CAF3577333.1 unnamed protein product [Rotaria sp. Silwood1]CAF3591498.1 unnamed protein product [Rotaria sp. Silwood1]CAF4601729.1 unnamed protein product [Rotaria sp. Silwood1]
MSNIDHHLSIEAPNESSMTKSGKKWHRRRSIIRDFAINTTMHGLPKVLNSEHIYSRIFWAISFAIFTVFMLYFIVRTILTYLQYPTQTNVSADIEWPQDFPAVSICNVASFRYDQFIGPFLNYTNALNLTYENITDVLSPVRIRNFIQYKVNRHESITQYSFSLHSMLYQCLYNYMPCSSTDFVPFISSVYGLCFTFNAKMKNSSVSVRYGNQYGGFGQLDLAFYVHSQQYVPYFVDSIGMVGLVHDNSQIPFMNPNGIGLAPGRKHKLSFRKKTNFFLSSPYTSCTNNIPLSMKVMLNEYNGADYGYSQLLCYELCIQAYAYEQCGCIDPYLWNIRYIVVPGTKNIILAPLCNSTNPCYHQVTDTLMASSFIETKCPDCTSQCSLISFPLQISSFTAPLEWQVNGIKAFVVNSSVPLPLDWSTAWRTYIQNNYVAVSIVREAGVVDNNRQQAQMTLGDIFSKVGGLTGLWIGLSFLSMMEFIEMLCRLINYQCHLILSAIRNKQ